MENQKSIIIDEKIEKYLKVIGEYIGTNDNYEIIFDTLLLRAKKIIRINGNNLLSENNEETRAVKKECGYLINTWDDIIIKLQGMNKNIILSHLERWIITIDEYIMEINRMMKYYIEKQEKITNPEQKIYNWLLHGEYETKRKNKYDEERYLGYSFTPKIKEIEDMDYAIAKAQIIRFNMTVKQYNEIVDKAYNDAKNKNKMIKKGWEKYLFVICRNNNKKIGNNGM